MTDTSGNAERDIAAYIEFAGLGTRGSTIFVNDKPTSPDAIICVFGYAGSPPERTHDTSGNDRPSVQVWVRGAANGSGAARTLLDKIYNLLDGVTNTSINGGFYVGIDAIQSGPTYMGKDDTTTPGRPEYVMNFACLRRRP